MKHDTLQETVRALPPVGVGALTIMGLALSDWVLILTLIYTLFLLIDKLPTVIERIKQFAAYIKRFRE